MLNIVRSFLKVAHTRSLASLPSASASLKLELGKELSFESKKFVKDREIWIENLDTEDEQKLGIMKLHQKIWAATPRIDIIQQNVQWQRMYRFVSFAHAKIRMEKRGGGRKP